MPGIPKARLDELRALAEKATPGPWGVAGDPRSVVAGEEPVLVEPEAEELDNDGSVLERYAAGRIEDLWFAAAAREAVPALLDEVERLRGEVEDRIPRGGNGVAGPNAEVLVAELERCHAILRRLNAAAGLPERYPSFAAKPVSDEDGDEVVARVEAMRALLREVEWSGGDAWMPCCPVCGTDGGTVRLRGEPPHQHAEGCRLASLLK